MLGRDDRDPLFLQMKEAEASALEPYLGRSEHENHGRRVVEGQRLMQAASDIMLGWIRTTEWIDGVNRDFYVRQLWDGKGSAPVDVLDPDVLGRYGELCGWALARAHARSGDAVAIGSYLGAGNTSTGRCAPLPTDTPIRTNAIMRLSGMPPTPAGSPFGLGCDERGAERARRRARRGSLARTRPGRSSLKLRSAAAQRRREPPSPNPRRARSRRPCDRSGVRA